MIALLKITGDNTPGNTNTNEFDLNNGGGVLIAILVCIIVILVISLFIKNYIDAKKLGEFQNLLKNDLSDNELQILSSYRKLNENDKKILQDTLNSLSKNHDKN